MQKAHLGLGLRRKKEKPSTGQGLNGPPLDPLKKSAIKEYFFNDAIVAAQTSYKIYNKG